MSRNAKLGVVFRPKQILRPLAVALWRSWRSSQMASCAVSACEKSTQWTEAMP